MAAFNIKGVTAHRLFSLPVQKGGVAAEYLPLSDAKLKTMREELRNVRLLIIDEVSMISNVTLAMIDTRLSELYPQDLLSELYQPFAGWNIMLLGDLLQLPPCGKGDTCGYIFDDISNKHQQAFTGCGLMPLGLWPEFSGTYVELQINKRQENDSSWADMLNRIRLGRQTREDVQRLESRLLQAENDDEAKLSRFDICVKRFSQQLKNGEPAVCLFPTLDPANQFNKRMLKQDKIDIVRIHARDTVPARNNKRKLRKVWDPEEHPEENNNKANDAKAKKNCKNSDSAGLESILKLGKGARVMLRRNLDVSEGQVNGALATVSRLIYKEQNQKLLVDAVAVKFDVRPDQEVFIRRVSSDYEEAKGRFISRDQFPLILAYGMTIHKCQGGHHLNNLYSSQ